MAIVIFSIFEFFFVKIKPVLFEIRDEKISKENVANNTQEIEIKEKDIKAKEYKETEEMDMTKIRVNKEVWQIEIPKISLVAPIEEGTSTKVMNKFVGHFEITSKWNGNIGLAAHNRRISC